jgi:nematocidal protein AidA
MSNTIDILTVVDCVSIQNALTAKTLSPGSPGNYQSLGSYLTSDAYIYMICADAYALNGTQTQSELQVAANVGDSIRWMITCPGGGTANNVILTGVNLGSFTPAPNQPAAAAGLTTPFSVPMNFKLYVGSATVPPTPIQFTNYAMEAVVIEAGTQQYYCEFIMTDQNGNPIGYFSWDPFVVISN